MIISTICAFWVAYSFGVLFNIKGKYLYIAGGGGALGWVVYKLFLSLGLFEATSLFIASIAFSIYSETCARAFRTPSTLIRVCSLIVLVPGYGIYNALKAFLVKDYTVAMDYTLNTLGSACALALGIILVSSIYKRGSIKKTT